MITRRSMLGFLFAAPAIIRTPGLLMPVKAIAMPAFEPLPPGVYTGRMANFMIQSDNAQRLLLEFTIEAMGGNHDIDGVVTGRWQHKRTVKWDMGL